MSASRGERPAWGVSFFCLLVGLTLAAACLVAWRRGELLDAGPIFLLAMLAGAAMFLGVGLAAAGVGGRVLQVVVGSSVVGFFLFFVLALLLTPDQVADPGNRRGPRTAAQAQVMGGLLAAAMLAVPISWLWSSIRLRRLHRSVADDGGAAGSDDPSRRRARLRRMRSARRRARGGS